MTRTEEQNKKELAKTPICKPIEPKISVFKSKPYLAAMIGTALEYYDNSLYWLMAPLMAPIFFPNMDPVYGLIMVFMIHPLGIITRPLGGWIIGRLGDKWGRRKALKFSITGTAVTTGLIGLIPSYEYIGAMAPILLAVLRLTQKFFVAGEYNGGAIFTLEHVKKRKGLLSGIYCSFTVIGVLTAAGVTSIVAHLPTGYWRIAYLIGFLTAIAGIYIRNKTPESEEFEKAQAQKKQPLALRVQFRSYWKAMLSCLGAAAFFGTLYTIPSSFLVGYLPLISDFKQPELILLHTGALALFMLALPVFGHLGDKISFKRSMLFAAAATALLGYPLFSLVNHGSLQAIILLKAGFMLLTAWFVGPFHAWTQEQYEVRSRYQLISVSYSIGSQIGAAMPLLCMWLWAKTHINTLPAVVLVIWAIIGTFSVYMSKKLEPDTSY